MSVAGAGEKGVEKKTQFTSFNHFDFSLLQALFSSARVGLFFELETNQHFPHLSLLRQTPPACFGLLSDREETHTSKFLEKQT